MNVLSKFVYETIPKIIHQIYFDFGHGASYTDVPCFADCVEKTITFCKKYGFKHIVWDLPKVRYLLRKFYPQYQRLWDDFTYPIMRCDFCRYLILNHFGGIYMDMDCMPAREFDGQLLNQEQFFTTWHNDTRNLPYNALMGSVKGNQLFRDIAEHAEESFYKRSQTLRKHWKGRLIFHTTGHYMLARVLKKHEISPKSYLEINRFKYRQPAAKEIIKCDNPYVIDYNVSLWWKDCCANKDKLWNNEWWSPTVQ